jgi:hypothetical protein
MRSRLSACKRFRAGVSLGSKHQVAKPSKPDFRECICLLGLNYKLRCFKQASEDPARVGSWIYTKVMQYLPIGLELEKDQTFLEGLGLFKDPMEMPMIQASDFWTNLNEAMVPDEDEAE